MRACQVRGRDAANISFDCFQIKMSVTFVAWCVYRVCMGNGDVYIQTGSNRFATNIGTYNLTSFLKFRCPMIPKKINGP